MDLLKQYSQKSGMNLVRLSTGCFSMDRSGQIVTSTMPQAFPVTQLEEIGRTIIEVFRSAQEAQIPLTELNINYAALKLNAREMRGGAIVFLAPRAMSPSMS
jgi:hypothetical protein